MGYDGDVIVWRYFSELETFYIKRYKSEKIYKYHFLAYGVDKFDVEKMIETVYEEPFVKFMNVRVSFFTLSSEYEHVDECWEDIVNDDVDDDWYLEIR